MEESTGVWDFGALLSQSAALSRHCDYFACFEFYGGLSLVAIFGKRRFFMTENNADYFNRIIDCRLSALVGVGLLSNFFCKRKFFLKRKGKKRSTSPMGLSIWRWRVAFVSRHTVIILRRTKMIKEVNQACGKAEIVDWGFPVELPNPEKESVKERLQLL